MGKSGSKTKKSSSKKNKNNAIPPKGDQSKTTEKENKILEKGAYLDYLDPNNPGDRIKRYISSAAIQDLDRIFMD